MKLNKNIKNFVNYFLGPLLFLWVSYSIYLQISSQPNLSESWKHIRESFGNSKILFFVSAIALMFLNWSVEAVKWQLAVNKVQRVSFFTAIKAVLSGVSVSVSTPNRVGEYLGRILYMSEGNRLKAISLTITGSISQLLVTLVVGCVGLLVLKDKIATALNIEIFWLQTILTGVVLVSAVVCLIYFRISILIKWLDRLPGVKKYAWLFDTIESFNATILAKILSLSILRYIIFIVQYYLLLHFFEAPVTLVQTLWSVSVSFLIMAIIPTIALFTDLGLRGTVSLRLIGLFSNNHLAISFVTISIWFINLIIPALAGSLLILGVRRIFKNKET